jgi:hypothetical protein
LRRYHLILMADHGIFFLPTKMGAFSYTHGERDVQMLLDATRSILSDSSTFREILKVPS